MNRLFKNVGIARIRRSAHDLSYEYKTTCNMGQIIPVQCDEVVPGDIWVQGIQAVIKALPLAAPPMHQIDVVFHSYFWPYRFLTDAEGTFDWEKYITGDEDGEDAQTLPRWEPTDTTAGSLWDYLGFPVGVNPTGAFPHDGPRQAYADIYNQYYRPEEIVAEIGYDNEDIQLACYEKDYFTSAQLDQQRGIAPALSLSGTTYADFSGGNAIVNGNGPPTTHNMVVSDGGVYPSIYINSSQGSSNALDALNNNEVDFADASTFDIAELRLTTQIQRWMERNQRAGARYTESLYAHFGIKRQDSRLQRPEYIGGSKNHVMMSEIPQTSQSDTTPQGTLAGKGTCVDRGFIGKYRVKEHGLIMTMMIIRPKSLYMQGINRQWLRYDREEFYWPEFANLSEQAIIRAEIYADGNDTNNNTVFGYAGHYDEMRVKHNMVTNLMRTDFDYWHCGRIFSSAPELNQTFLEVDNADVNRPWVALDEPSFICTIGNNIKAIRPIPIIAEPGYMDHN